jgi:hypothetical protein
MTAENNLMCLPMELLGEDLNNLELQAAIVFTVFARLLDKDLLDTTLQKVWPDKFGNLDGYLYKYLNMAHCASYAQIDNTILLFAHGGITSEFVKSESSGLDILEKVTDDEWKSISNSPLYPIPISPPPTQQGGGVNNIFDKIDSFCSKYKILFNQLYSNPANNTNTNETNYSNLLKQFPNDNSKLLYPSKTLQILTSICTPAENHPLIKYKEYMTNYSPIQAISPMGTDLHTALDITGGDKTKINIINIFSHIPKGIGYSFGMVNEHMYFINTDFSNSLMKDPNLVGKTIKVTDANGKSTVQTATYTETYNTNYLLLHLRDANRFVLDGNITLILDNYPKIDTFLDSGSFIAGNLSATDSICAPDLILPDNKTIKLTFNDNIPLNNLKFSMRNCIIEKQCFPKGNYFNHGNVNINDVRYKLISKAGTSPPFQKNIGLFLFSNIEEKTQSLLSLSQPKLINTPPTQQSSRLNMSKYEKFTQTAGKRKSKRNKHKTNTKSTRHKTNTKSTRHKTNTKSKNMKYKSISHKSNKK